MISPALPALRVLIEEDRGGDGLRARAYARLEITLPRELDFYYHGADTVLTGSVRANPSITDSMAASFHTSAAASVQVNDRIEFTVPELGPGDRFWIRTTLTGPLDDFTTDYGGTFRVSRVSDDLTLFTTSSPVSWRDLNLTAHEGEAIALEFTAAVSMAGAAGFGGGADALPARSFSSSLWAGFAMRHEIGEPLLETFATSESSFASGGWVLDELSFIGVRFTVSEPVYLESAFGNISGSGDFFVAVDSIASSVALPNVGVDFDPDSVQAYATATSPGSPSSDLEFTLGKELAPGDYVVFFGGLPGSSGWMPWAPDLSASSIPLSDYLEFYPGQDWFEFPDSGVRIVLTTNPDPCNDGVDNDGDGFCDTLAATCTDGSRPGDAGCESPHDLGEKSPHYECDNGDDDDLDGLVDLADPGCTLPFQAREETLCQNGEDEDRDGLKDFDGGQSIHGECTPGPFGCPAGVSDLGNDGVADPDPECLGRAWWNSETSPSLGCGLGFELAFLLPALMWLDGRRRRAAT